MGNKALAATSAALLGVVPSAAAIEPQDFGSSIYESHNHARILVRSQQTISPRSDLSWLADAEESLSKLASLGENWDSYGAKRIEPENVRQTLQILAEVMKPEIAFPWITPLANGGLQMEWDGTDEGSFVGIEVEGNSTTAYVGDEEFPLTGPGRDRVREQVTRLSS